MNAYHKGQRVRVSGRFTDAAGGVGVVDYTGSSGDGERELVCLVSNDADLTAGDGTQVKFLTPSGLFEFQ